MAKKATWAAFPHPHEAFDYSGPELKKRWASLHLGDRERSRCGGRIPVERATGARRRCPRHDPVDRHRCHEVVAVDR